MGSKFHVWSPQKILTIRYCEAIVEATIPAVLTPFVILLMTCCKIESSAPLNLERILSIRLSWFFDFLVFVCRLSSKFCSLSGVRSCVRLKSHLQSCLVSLREALASWQSTVSGFLARWLPRSLHSLATTMDIFVCAIFCHCEHKRSNQQAKNPHDSDFAHGRLPRSPNGLARNDG